MSVWDKEHPDKKLPLIWMSPGYMPWSVFIRKYHTGKIGRKENNMMKKKEIINTKTVDIEK